MQRHTSDLRSIYDHLPAPFGKRIIPLWVVAGLGMSIVLGIIAGSYPSQETAWSNQGGVRVWTDPATGCRYTQAETGMQPLVGPDGRPDCLRRPQ